MKKQIVFGLGCFWGVQKYFDQIEGIIETEVGYAGGFDEDATYQSIGDHTEVLKIIYEEDDVSFEDLIDAFIEKKDPTFPGYKTQYDSLVLYNTPEEEKVTLRKLENEQTKHDRSINIRVEAFENYYKAEEYHQKFHEKQERTGSIIS